MTGYLSPQYAAALAEFGEPLALPQCQGWLLCRPIGQTPYRDAMGCYPLFTCRNWAELPVDIAALTGDLVSVALVLDPFGNWDLSALKLCFDRVVPFKEHFVVDLAAAPETFVSKHHRYYARKALRELRVERCANPALHVDEWVSLYAHLIQRYELRGIKAFSRQSFAKQVSIPGIVMFRILKGNICVGAHLWFVQGNVAYSHLMAVSDEGYSMNASYGLYSEAIRMFRETCADGLRWLQVGAGAGASVAATDGDGLAQFKRGWATTTRLACFCGKVLNRPNYAAICRELGVGNTEYFPAYRADEFR